MAYIDDDIIPGSSEPSKPYEILAPGEYEVMVVGSDYKVNSKNTGKVIELEFEVINGDRKFAKLKQAYNVIHQNEQAQRIANQEFSALCCAVFERPMHEKLKDTQTLHNRPFIALVGVEVSKNKDGSEQINPKSGKPYSPKNAIKGYKTRHGVTAEDVYKGKAAAPTHIPSAPPTQHTGTSSGTPPWGQPAAGVR